MAVSTDSNIVSPNITDTIITDPPPPYPSAERRSRRLGTHQNRGHNTRIQSSRSHHTQYSSADTYSEQDGHSSPYIEEDGPSETTPFLSPSSRADHHRGAGGRPRTHSLTSTTSAATSLSHTVLSLFQEDVGENESVALPLDDGNSTLSARRTGCLSKSAWKRYFRPLGRRVYWRSLLHLLVINFPYALAAWVYLFVFTVTGTTLLVALPLGAVLCFFDLVGARAFSRGELALQTRFHEKLAHPPPYPPRPIFTRYREVTAAELEESSNLLHRGSLVRERSFYKNSYAMFTDPTSYQALFYFLVIKPAITLLITIGLIAFGLPLFLLVLPAPAVLRATRKIGVWQANVAFEGLYLAVR